LIRFKIGLLIDIIEVCAIMPDLSRDLIGR
jgi:hypothetical protein